MYHVPPITTLLPYTTLFRSRSNSVSGNTYTQRSCPLVMTRPVASCSRKRAGRVRRNLSSRRSEEHTSELQSRGQLVCRLLLENKNKRSGRECEVPIANNFTT